MPTDAPVPEPGSESGQRQLCPACKPQPVGRSRVVYAVSIALVIAAGLLWRSGLMPLPLFFKKYGGDALWALLVFLGFGWVFRRASTFNWPDLVAYAVGILLGVLAEVGLARSARAQ